MVWILLLVAAVFVAWVLLRRRAGRNTEIIAKNDPSRRHPLRQDDDPADNLGRRKDDNVGGED